MTLFQYVIGAYFKSIEAVKISNLCGSLAFLVAACEKVADENEKGGAGGCQSCCFLSHLDH